MIDEFILINYNTPESREYARSNFRWFEKFLKEKNKDIYSIDQRDIIEFRRWLEENRGKNGKKLNPKTIRNILDVVKSFYEFLESMGYENPFKKIPPKILKSIFPKYKKEKVPKEFKSEELKTIIEELKKKDKSVLIASLISILSGARLREVLNLRKEDFIEKNGKLMIIIRHGKGMKERVSILGIPYKDFLTEKVLDPYLEELNKWGTNLIKEFIKDKEGYIFGNEEERKRLRWRIQQTIYRISKKTGIKFRFHDFRANWGNKALLCRVPLEYIRKQLGHSKTETTELYYARIKDELVLSELSKIS